MIRTQIQLRDEQFSSLKKLAESKGVSMAELVRQGVDLVIRQGNVLSDEQLRARALAAAGRFRSGSTDVAQRHDHYLSGLFGE
ncbi:MAG: CopG family transcriptional regulator [Pirellulales bacterium]